MFQGELKKPLMYDTVLIELSPCTVCGLISIPLTFLTAKTSLKIAADGKDGFFFDRKASYVKSDPMLN